MILARLDHVSVGVWFVTFLLTLEILRKMVRENEDSHTSS